MLLKCVKKVFPIDNRQFEKVILPTHLIPTGESYNVKMKKKKKRTGRIQTIWDEYIRKAQLFYYLKGKGHTSWKYNRVN